jgi:hypothetical protein
LVYADDAIYTVSIVVTQYPQDKTEHMRVTYAALQLNPSVDTFNRQKAKYGAEGE